MHIAKKENWYAKASNKVWHARHYALLHKEDDSDRVYKSYKDLDSTYMAYPATQMIDHKIFVLKVSG